MGAPKPENSRALFDEQNAGGTMEEVDGTVSSTPDDTVKETPVEEQPASDEAAEELSIITEIHEMKFGDIHDLADRFYKSMKFYKDGERWKLPQIRAQSKELPSMIQEMEDLLEQGGIKSPGQRKELLAAVVEIAQTSASGHDFWHGISDHKTMVAKSASDKFYRAIVAGLQENENQTSKEVPLAA